MGWNYTVIVLVLTSSASTALEKFPDDGHAWSLDRIEFDELTAGYCSPSLERLPANAASPGPAGTHSASTVVPSDVFPRFYRLEWCSVRSLGS